jgi:hypothetical protein
VSAVRPTANSVVIEDFAKDAVTFTFFEDGSGTVAIGMDGSVVLLAEDVREVLSVLAEVMQR